MALGCGRLQAIIQPSSRPPSSLTLHWPPLIAVGASALLIALIGLNASGWQHAFADTSDRDAYGQPTGQRQAVLIAYLREQQITRFYTDYWTCYKVVFATDQQVSCAVFHNERVFDRWQDTPERYERSGRRNTPRALCLRHERPATTGSR